MENLPASRRPREVPVFVVSALVLLALAAASLVAGLGGGDVGDLYLSMVLCAASLAVLAVSARTARPPVASPMAGPASVAPPGDFPIADYGSLDAGQILALVPELEPQDLDRVRAVEREGEARVSILVAVANELASRR